MGKEKAELFALLFLCPFIWKETSVCFDRGPVRHFGHPVEQVGEIFEEVDVMQPADDDLYASGGSGDMTKCVKASQFAELSMFSKNF